MDFLKYMFTPKLFKEYGSGDFMCKLVCNIGYYTSPLLVIYMIQQGSYEIETFLPIVKITFGISTIGIISVCIRGIGRSRSQSYSKFVRVLKKFQANPTTKNRKELAKFDFDFRHWPVDFEDTSHATTRSFKQQLIKPQLLCFWKSSFARECLAYVAIHTFGIRMIFPGCLKLLQKFIESTLIVGRTKLIERDNGERFKLKTSDLNEIDVLVVDNRTRSKNGKTLVICSEGNAGFYEIGILLTPLSLKYSVIGWNHPGFAGSTGLPFPQQDENAIDSVIQFAIQRLNFELNSIILFGWSIGGYVTIWAGLKYAGIKGVILDATFDDILYLAQSKVPNILSNIVKTAIRSYVNLNILDLAYSYNGPILIIRRSNDEIICTDENDMASNRGNFLLVNILKHRYPNIFKPSQTSCTFKYISRPFTRTEDQTNENIYASMLASYVSAHGKCYPVCIGENWNDKQRKSFAEFLIRKHLLDVQASHCMPLPTEFFQLPWDLPSGGIY